MSLRRLEFDPGVLCLGQRTLEYLLKNGCSTPPPEGRIFEGQSSVRHNACSSAASIDAQGEQLSVITQINGNFQVHRFTSETNFETDVLPILETFLHIPQLPPSQKIRDEFMRALTILSTTTGADFKPVDLWNRGIGSELSSREKGILRRLIDSVLRFRTILDAAANSASTKFRGLTVWRLADCIGFSQLINERVVTLSFDLNQVDSGLLHLQVIVKPFPSFPGTGQTFRFPSSRIGFGIIYRRRLTKIFSDKSFLHSTS